MRFLYETHDGVLKDKRDSTFLLVHGWMMWICWGLCGFIMVWSNRYLKHRWQLNMIIHSVCGTLVFILNLIFGLGAMCYMKWEIICTIHGIVGSLISITLPITCAEGVVSRTLFRTLRWRTSILVKINLTHRVSQLFAHNVET